MKIKIKISYVWLGVLSLSVILLSVYILIQKPICERIHIDDNMKLWGTKDAVPDEKTAKKIADIIIDAQSGFEPIFDYTVEVNYNADKNEWELLYHPGAVSGGGITIHLRKDNGMVTDFWFYK